MPQPNVAIYGSHSCPDTQRAVAYLDSRDIPHEFKDVDQSPEFNDYIASLNHGKRVTPTIQINNETFINPSQTELARAVDAAAADPAGS